MAEVIDFNNLKNKAALSEDVVTLDISTNKHSDVKVKVDFESLGIVANGAKWYPHGKSGYLYAVQSSSKEFQQLHRLLLGNPLGLLVDHINGNTLDNRIANLRACTPHGNMRNQIVNKSNKSGLKGVVARKSAKGTKFFCCIFVHGKQIDLGTYGNPLDAAYAYDIAAIKYYGEFAKTNRSQGLFDRDFDELFPCSKRQSIIEVDLDMQNTYSNGMVA